MKKFLTIILLLFLSISVSAQIKVTSKIIKGDKPKFCPTDCLEIVLTYSNVPYLMTGASYTMKNIDILSIQPYRRISDNTYEETMTIQVKRDFVGNAAYIYIHNICGITQKSRLDMIPFQLVKDVDDVKSSLR